MDLLWWRRPHRMTGRDAERLLDRTPADDAPPGLDDLLAAAAAPARPGELAGEKEAVATFRREYRPVRESHDGSEVSRARRPRRRVAAVALCAVVALFGGTAYAAGTNRLPDPVQRELHEALAGVGVPPPEPRVAAPPVLSPTPATGPTPATSPGASSGASSGPEHLVGLCRAWQATRSTPGAPQIRPDERRQLSEAAGGPNRIEEFCAALSATARATPGAPTTAPGRSGTPGPGGPPATPPGKGNGNGNGNGKGNGNGNGNGPPR